MIKQLVSMSLVFSLGISSVFASASAVVIDGTKPGMITLLQPVTTSAKGMVNLQNAATINKRILFQHIVLSADAQRYLVDHIDGSQEATDLAAVTAAPADAVENAMDNVPVLDQGAFGTCATFATTAALDAAYHHGDYISQLCNLELGQYLHHYHPSYPSGWDGASAESILWQAKTYGVVNIAYQKQAGCGGLKAYPKSGSMGGPMSTMSFVQHSQKIMTALSYKSLMNINDAFSARVNTTTLLGAVKLALLKGHRVVVGILIDDFVSDAGIQASYQAPSDSWVLTPAIIKDVKSKVLDGGHALIITGYNENAVITDIFKVPHKGVLTLRNSWGAAAGNQGTYYMSYDYFKAMVMEAKEIIPTV